MKKALYGWMYISDLPRHLQYKNDGRDWRYYTVKITGQYSNGRVRVERAGETFSRWGRMIHKSNPAKGPRWNLPPRFTYKDFRDLPQLKMPSPDVEQYV